MCSSERAIQCAGQQQTQLKWADSLDGLVKLGNRLHSMSALADVPHIIRWGPIKSVPAYCFIDSRQHMSAPHQHHSKRCSRQPIAPDSA